MKRIIFCALCLIFLLVLPFIVQAQVYEGVATVYYQSFAYPENFDQWLANNRNLLTGDFNTCLNSIEQVWRAQTAIDDQICKAMPDPAYCKGQCQSFKMVYYIDCLRQTLNGKKWLETSCGAAGSIIKRQQPGPYVEAINSNWPILRMPWICIAR